MIGLNLHDKGSEFGEGGKKDVCLFPRTENLFPRRLQEDSTPCCPLDLRLFSLGIHKGAFMNVIV